MHFDSRLTDNSILIHELDLCTIFLKNDASYPWVTLVPKREGIKEIYELNADDQLLLIREISVVSRLMQSCFKPEKLNVAALGNIVQQLHVHIVARSKHDKTWPHGIWQPNQTTVPYSEQELNNLIQTIAQELQKLLSN